MAAALAKHLHAEDLAQYDPDGVTGDCFIAHMPQTPHEAVAIFPGPGDENGTRLPHDVVTVQLLVRGPEYDPRPGMVRAKALIDALDCLDGVLLDEGGPDEVWVQGITAMQSHPAPIGPDENDRHEWSCNFRVHLHHPTPNRQ